MAAKHIRYLKKHTTDSNRIMALKRDKCCYTLKKLEILLTSLQ